MACLQIQRALKLVAGEVSPVKKPHSNTMRETNAANAGKEPSASNKLTGVSQSLLERVRSLLEPVHGVIRA